MPVSKLRRAASAAETGGSGGSGGAAARLLVFSGVLLAVLCDLLVVVLVIYHVWCGKIVADFKHDRNRHGHVFYRWFNEFPVLILFELGVYLSGWFVSRKDTVDDADEDPGRYEPLTETEMDDELDRIEAEEQRD